MAQRLPRCSIFCLLLSLVLMGASMAASHSSGGDKDYRIAPEDVLSVSVFDEPDLSVEEARVSVNGTISLPLIGPIHVAGMTTRQVAAKIRELLADGYLKNPRVGVSVVEYRFVYVSGAVKQPGGYNYQDGLTVQRAIVLAGGLDERASEDKITITHEGDEDHPVRVDMNDLVRPGDVIHVGESFF